MNKVELISALLLLINLSCSKEKEQSETEQVLIKKIITYDSMVGSGNAKTFTFSYFDNTKLVNIVDEAGNEVLGCNYDFDLIKELIYDNNNRITYTYDDTKRLVSFDDRHNNSPGYPHITEFVYNDDGSIDVTHEARTGNQWVDKYSILNGVLTKIGITREVKFTYDQKNYPYKNITGFDKIFLSAPFSITEAAYGNSIITYESIHNLVGFTNFNYPSNPIHYNYNTSDYPTKREVIGSDRTYTSEYYY